MPTVGELFHSLKRDKVLDFVIEYYYDNDFDARGEFEKVWADILTLQPMPNNGMICEVLQRSEWVDVGGRQNDEKLAIEFMPWPQWLEMPIKTEFNEVETLGHILCEMTFFSFDPVKIQEKFKSLVESVEEIKNALDTNPTHRQND